MQRYQIYLESESVAVLDELARITRLSRSKIIRDVINQMARQYEKILESHRKKSLKNNPLLKMAGYAKGPNRDIAHHVNDIYLKD